MWFHDFSMMDTLTCLDFGVAHARLAVMSGGAVLGHGDGMEVPP